MRARLKRSVVPEFIIINIWSYVVCPPHIWSVFLYSSHKLHLVGVLPHSEHHVMPHNLPTRTRCINSDQRNGAVPPSSPMLGGRWEGENVGGGSPINHLLTNCRTGRFARRMRRSGRAVLAGRLFLRTAPSSLWITQEGSRGIYEGGGSAETGEETGDYGVY